MAGRIMKPDLKSKWLWLGEVMENPDNNGAAKSVAYFLADHVRTDAGLAWPAVETLADLMHVDRRTVMRAVRQLERAGHIECVVATKGGRRVTNRWALRLKTGSTLPPFAQRNGGKVVRKQGQGCPKTGARLSPDSLKDSNKDSVRALERGGARLVIEPVKHDLGPEWPTFKDGVAASVDLVAGGFAHAPAHVRDLALSMQAKQEGAIE